MTVKQYKFSKLILFSILFLLILFSFYLKNLMPTFLGLGFYLALISLLKTRVDGILADERQITVSEKAAQVSFQILMPILLLTSVALFIGPQNQDFYYLKSLGTVIAYITCLGLMIYLFSFFYFDRKTGGK